MPPTSTGRGVRNVEAPVTGIRIRTVTDDELRAVVAHYGAGGGESPWDPFANLERIRRIPRHGLLAAEHGGAYAGFLFWYEARKPWYDPSVDRYARISDLHIVPTSQGKGIGRARFPSEEPETQRDLRSGQHESQQCSDHYLRRSVDP